MDQVRHRVFLWVIWLVPTPGWTSNGSIFRSLLLGNLDSLENKIPISCLENINLNASILGTNPGKNGWRFQLPVSEALFNPLVFSKVKYTWSSLVRGTLFGPLRSNQFEGKSEVFKCLKWSLHISGHSAGPLTSKELLPVVISSKSFKYKW